MNKKASENWAPDTILFYLLGGILIGFGAIIFAIFFSQYGSEQAEINGNIENIFLASRFESAECFGYSKDGILSVNKIDYGKFSQARLDNCFNTENLRRAFRVTIKSEDAGIEDSKATRNWNSNRGFDERLPDKNVILHHNGVNYRGRMSIEIQK